jgi:hypothetical protein
MTDLFGVVLSCVALAGCNSGNPEQGSPAYREGKLGNGSFLFRCDDSVACDRWSTNSAKDFPTRIATGSTFNLRFVVDGKEGGTLDINGTTYTGITLEPVRPYVSSGPNGLSAIQPGYGTVLAKDASGHIIDYVTLMIVQPDSLVVYKADYKGSAPPPVQAIRMTVGERQSFRTVAQYKLEAIAGSIQVGWNPLDRAVADVESYTKGVVTIVAKSEGKTTLAVQGAALPEGNIAVEVTKP